MAIPTSPARKLSTTPALGNVSPSVETTTTTVAKSNGSAARHALIPSSGATFTGTSETMFNNFMANVSLVLKLLKLVSSSSTKTPDPENETLPACIDNFFGFKIGGDFVDRQPLIGLPSRATVDGVALQFGPYLVARQAAEVYCRLAGIKPRFPRVYSKLNKARAAEIAALYEQLEHTPLDPETIASYKALCTEAMAQWQVVKATGLQVEFTEDQEPYKNPRKVILDIIENNHLYVTPTRSAYGDTAFEADPNNPLLVETDEIVSGTPALVNDIFRVVHDYFGHTKEGLGFRAEGEENAWRCHAAMFSPLARRAMTTELRGQNSWINYGPHGEANRRAGMEDTQFAPQKMGLLPEWVSSDGMDDPEF